METSFTKFNDRISNLLKIKKKLGNSISIGFNFIAWKIWNSIVVSAFIFFSKCNKP